VGATGSRGGAGGGRAARDEGVPAATLPVGGGAVDRIWQFSIRTAVPEYCGGQQPLYPVRRRLARLRSN
jgi:hypothetical protein